MACDAATLEALLQADGTAKLSYRDLLICLASVLGQRAGFGSAQTTNLVSGTWPAPTGGLLFCEVVVNVTVGQSYTYIQGNSTGLSTNPLLPVPPNLVPPGNFTATQATYYLVAASATQGQPITAQILSQTTALNFAKSHGMAGLSERDLWMAFEAALCR